MAKNAKYHDLHLPDFIDEFKDLSGSVSKINLTVFKNRSVRCIGDDEQIIRKWSLYNCLSVKLITMVKCICLAAVSGTV